jgi:hypothetical protein
MKLKTTLKPLIILMLVGLFSCETDQNSPVTQDLESFDGSMRYNTSVARLHAPDDAKDGLCDESRLYELRDPWNLEVPWGTVVVSNDGEKLYIQINPIDGYLIHAVWHYIGTEWPYTEDPLGDWYTFPGIDVTYPGLPSTHTLEYDLEDWMERGCFVIALKVRLWVDKENPDSEGQQIPRVYINYGDHLEYIWNDPYCLCYGPGTGTPGYWKNHPDAWPVDEITIGGVTYTKEEAITIMKAKKVDGDKTYDMFNHLVSAMLNVETGNISYCINDAISDANDWMATNGPVGSGVEADSEAWQDGGEDLKDMLDDYNNGKLCADKRD